MRLSKKMRMSDRRTGILLTGVTAVLLLWLSWCFSTIAYQGEQYVLPCVAAAFGALGCYLFCITKSVEWERIRGQIYLLNGILVLFFVLLLISDIRRAEYGLYYAVTDIAWIVCGLYCAVRLKRQREADIRVYYPFLLLMAAAGLLAIEPFQVQLRWDGALYELACRDMDVRSLSSLGAYGHLSQAYGGLYCMINTIINNPPVTMAAMNVLFYLGSIAGFYLTIRYLIPGRQRGLYLAGAAFYAFSPFLLGMVNYYSLDYATTCFFIWVVYFAFSKRWILHFMAALCFCFTKEPAIVAYGAFCMGIVLMNWCEENTDSVSERIRRVFSHYEYYLMLLTGLLWLVMYLLIGGWSGGAGEFAIDNAYVLDKLKVLYVLNFNWLMVFIIIAGGIRIVWNQIKNQAVYRLMWWIPLMLSLAAFTVFSVMFKTVNHARYAAAVPIILYLTAFSVLAVLWKENMVRNAMMALSLLMLVSSYRTVDFVSLLCFQRVNTGTSVMLSTGSPVMGDSMIYNKQMLWEETAFNQALVYALKEELPIYIPTQNGSMYAFDGMMVSGVERGAYYEVEQYWDAVDKRRYNYERSGTQPFVMYELKTEYTDIQTPLMEGTKKSCYIYSELLGEESAEKLKAEYPEAQCKEFSYRGWTVFMLVF